MSFSLNCLVSSILWLLFKQEWCIWANMPHFRTLKDNALYMMLCVVICSQYERTRKGGLLLHSALSLLSQQLLPSVTLLENMSKMLAIAAILQLFSIDNYEKTQEGDLLDAWCHFCSLQNFKSSVTLVKNMLQYYILANFASTAATYSLLLC